MDKDTIFELLKIFGMIIILAVLICGLVWLNKAQDISANTIKTDVIAEKAENTESINKKETNKSVKEKKSDSKSKSKNNKK